MLKNHDNRLQTSVFESWKCFRIHAEWYRLQMMVMEELSIQDYSKQHSENCEMLIQL
uniref:Uncharacterized protein n=1 Tax=Anguilla anguilla TaxID=7936 RepID=A0A0E9RVG8_ANGAN